MYLQKKKKKNQNKKNMELDISSELPSKIILMKWIVLI